MRDLRFPNARASSGDASCNGVCDGTATTGTDGEALEMASLGKSPAELDSTATTGEAFGTASFGSTTGMLACTEHA